MDKLRNEMRKHGIQFKITKNRITKLALEKSKCKDLSESMNISMRKLAEKLCAKVGVSFSQFTSYEEQCLLFPVNESYHCRAFLFDQLV